MGHLLNKVNLGVGQIVKVAYGSTPTCANIGTIVSTCEQETKERRTCTVSERVAVVTVEEQFEFIHIAFLLRR